MGVGCGGGSFVDSRSWENVDSHADKPWGLHCQPGRCRWTVGGSSDASRCPRTSRGRRGGWFGRWWWKSSKQRRAESIGGGSEPIATAGFVGSERQEKREGQEVQEGSKKGEEDQEKAKEERPAILKHQQQLQQQWQVPISKQSIIQQQYEQQAQTSPMAGTWEGPEGHIRRSRTCGATQAEEARRSSGLCGQEPRSSDGAFLGWGLCSSLEGHGQSIEPIAGGFSSELGTSVQWPFRSQGFEGSLDSLRDPRPDQPQGDCSGPGCVVPEGRSDPSSKGKRWILGEGGGAGVGEQPTDSGSQQHAGVDELMRDKVRRSWLSMGGFASQDMLFNAYFVRAMKALEVGLGASQRGTALGDQFRSLMAQLGSMGRHDEFKSVRRSDGTGKSPSHVFPLPPMSRGGTFLCGTNIKSPSDRVCKAGGNMVVTCLNWMHGGQRQRDEQPVLSAAHCRVHSRIERALEAMVMTDEPVLTNCGLDQFLRQSEFYTGDGVSLALGVKGGVPEKAADVPLANHLSEHFPEMAKQVVRPSCLLLASKRRPRRVKRGYTWLAPSYPELVKRNVQAGLHRYKKASQVAKHRGVQCLAGAFAVKKDSNEDRVITDPSVNQLLDPDKLPRPKFAYIPSLRCLTVPPQGIVAVSKRDPRHYFHRLRIGKNWHRWLCGPPVTVAGRGGSRKLFPASCSAPMGFGPSAGWAQGLTDVVAIDAQMPPDCRIHPDIVIPESLPIWGSIIDDIWALEHVADNEVATTGPSWLQQAETAWIVRDVAPNTKKSVDGAHGEEIQGYYVHPTGHWVGLSHEKRRFLFQASFKVLMQRSTHLKVIERLIGKHGFLHSCRPCMRSIFGCTYTWLDKARKKKPGPVNLPFEVWVELLVSTILIPFAEFNLSSNWSTRVEATDASMSGLGRSFGYVPEHVVKVLARYLSHKGVYTNLKLPWSVHLTSQHTCPLRRVRLPIERIKWFHIGTPWTPKHITLGEADAVVWCAEDRLRRANDEGCRFIHPLDSTACVGAFSKGRSSSTLINARCRAVGAINIAGGHDVFYPWVPSKENPADTPSRWFEPAAGVSNDGELASEGAEFDLRGLPIWAEDAVFFFHFCSGPDRFDDLVFQVEKQGGALGMNIVGIRVDPLAWLGAGDDNLSSGDLLQAKVGHTILDMIHSKRVIGGFGSPPCSTISAARHVPLNTRGGPRPLRSRQNPWQPLNYCTEKEIHAVRVGNILYLLCLGLLGEIRMEGGWIGLEHPADRKCEPFPSFFTTSVVQQWMQFFRMAYWVTDQCRFGAKSRKPTGLLLPPKSGSIVQFCNHKQGHLALIGLDVHGHFHTTPAARYPAPFCEKIAQLCLQQVVHSNNAGYKRPFQPLHHVLTQSSACLDPWTNTCHVSYPWFEPCPNFLAGELEIFHSRQVYGGLAKPQQ